ncbi:hypothetical protein, partial [Dysgonomonas sp. 511]|uniref:hypothetical protein n=1 Tax=Dysgonomonas sp. 511 TaxID=2302930 RepID=UPI0013D7F810
VEGIHVYVLYPKGKVSPIQECQFTTLGQNIRWNEEYSAVPGLANLEKGMYDSKWTEWNPGYSTQHVLNRFKGMRYPSDISLSLI